MATNPPTTGATGGASLGVAPAPAGAFTPAPTTAPAPTPAPPAPTPAPPPPAPTPAPPPPAPTPAPAASAPAAPKTLYVKNTMPRAVTLAGVLLVPDRIGKVTADPDGVIERDAKAEPGLELVSAAEAKRAGVDVDDTTETADVLHPANDAVTPFGAATPTGWRDPLAPLSDKERAQLVKDAQAAQKSTA